MKVFIRWLKFNMVGAMGFVLQIASLALFHRLLGTHYLLASGAATEVTLLHNFTWHLHYTWRDRRSGSPAWRYFVRYQLTNGTVSLAGNLLLVRVFVQAAHLPVIVSNILAILCCSLINFFVGHLWAFRSGHALTSASPAQSS